jgi:hypothetical protein
MYAMESRRSQPGRPEERQSASGSAPGGRCKAAWKNSELNDLIAGRDLRTRVRLLVVGLGDLGTRVGLLFVGLGDLGRFLLAPVREGVYLLATLARQYPRRYLTIAVLASSVRRLLLPFRPCLLLRYFYLRKMWNMWGFGVHPILLNPFKYSSPKILFPKPDVAYALWC